MDHRRVSSRYPEHSFSSKKAGAFKAKQRRAGGITALRALMGRSTTPAAFYTPRHTGATELKSVDSYSDGNPNVTVPFLTAGTVQQILGPETSDPGIVSGSAFYNRIGSRIRTKSLEIRGRIVPSDGNAAAVGFQYGRLLIVYDRQPNGALPAVSDILLDYQGGGTTVSNSYSGINMNNRDRFLILRDRKLYLLPLGVDGATPGKVTGIQSCPMEADKDYNVHEYIRCKDLETHYKASTGVIGDVATGSFIILCISDGDANATAAWNLNYTVRQKFLD